MFNTSQFALSDVFIKFWRKIIPNVLVDTCLHQLFKI